MSTSINTNIAAYYSQTNLRASSSSTESSIARLSSGNKIIKASDDVAGLSVGTSLRTAVNTLKTAYANTQQASSLLQVADGGLSNVTEILQRQKSLATQATSGSLSDVERGYLNQEFKNLTNEIDRLVQNTKFNKITLLDGSLTGTSATKIVDLTAAATVLGAANGITVASTAPINFFQNNAISGGTGAAQAQFVDQSNVALTDREFAALGNGVIGNFGKFTVSNVIADVSATVSVNLNGITLSGTVADAAPNNRFTLSNGNVRVQFTVSAAIDWATETTTQAFVATANSTTTGTGFGGMKTMATMGVAGFEPAGTYLAGLSATPLLRVSDTSDLSIKNFRVLSLTTGNNTLAVDIGGKTFTATGVINSPVAATVLSFANGDDALRIALTGLPATTAPNIFTNASDRTNFINGLNAAFTNASGALGFQTGATVSDNISVGIRSVSSQTLYNSQVLDISTLAGANVAGAQLDSALNYVSAVRADVGASQSRFNYAGANLQSAIQNVDAARGTFLDTDVSAESTKFANSQVLTQASISVLAQANQLPQNLLKLIG
jgi:flagellin